MDVKKNESGKTVAVVTYSGLDHISPSEEVLLRSLIKHEFTPFPVAWDDKSISWLDYDIVLLRACWNYHLDYQRFLTWIKLIENSGIPLWNTSDVVRWNASKIYLKDLQIKNIPVIPTYFVDRGSSIDLTDILNSHGWNQGVIKPMIGAGAHETYRINIDSASCMQSKFEKIKNENGVIVQPFLPDIIEGEYSFIFIAKEYSHSILKKPKSHDFRVGYGHGGTEILINPTQYLRQQAEKVISAIDKPLLYARVDGVITTEGFLLMELELIEPRLSFDLFPTGAEKFARALANFT